MNPVCRQACDVVRALGPRQSATRPDEVDETELGCDAACKRRSGSVAYLQNNSTLSRPRCWTRTGGTAWPGTKATTQPSARNQTEPKRTSSCLSERTYSAWISIRSKPASVTTKPITAVTATQKITPTMP